MIAFGTATGHRFNGTTGFWAGVSGYLIAAFPARQPTNLSGGRNGTAVRCDSHVGDVLIRVSDEEDPRDDGMEHSIVKLRSEEVRSLLMK